ncbi:MAG TPA: amidohydrolase family protein [Acidimicrobiales bacterium]
MLIVGGEVDGRPGVDVRVDGDRVAEVGPGLARAAGEPVVEADGGAVIPALHDHHVHLRSLAASRASVRLGPPAVRDRAQFTAALRAAAADASDGAWVRGVGYHESVAGPLDRAALDAVVADRPVRVQHRSGELWVLNSAALRAVGRPNHGSGRLWRADRWLADVVPRVPLDLDAVSREAAACGVAGFTDADPERTQADLDALAAAARAGELRQRVVAMSAGGLDVDAGVGLAAGPRKLLLDDATLPPLPDLAATIAAAHHRGEPVAVHCVTRAQLVVTLAALDDAGPRAGDRIEHAAVVPPELRDDMRRLGVTVVTQPHFVAERGDEYLTDVDPADRDLLYPCASLRAAGVPVAAGSDAPFGRPDPWAAMRAAVDRRTASGAVVAGTERVAARAALGLFLGRPDAPGVERRVEPGEPADLCVLDRPLAAALAALAPDAVAVTIARGRIVADNR